MSFKQPSSSRLRVIEHDHSFEDFDWNALRELSKNLDHFLDYDCSSAVEKMLHERFINERFRRAVEYWSVSGKGIIHYDFGKAIPETIHPNALLNRANPRVKHKSDIKKNEMTAEFKFFDTWFKYLSGTKLFNNHFQNGWNMFKHFATNHRTGRFSSSEFEQCFANISTYDQVIHFALCLLSQAVAAVPKENRVGFLQLLELQRLANDVVKGRMSEYQKVGPKKRDEAHKHQIKKWASVAAYLGMCLQVVARLESTFDLELK